MTIAARLTVCDEVSGKKLLTLPRCAKKFYGGCKPAKKLL
jgi:hypothetical protein